MSCEVSGPPLLSPAWSQCGPGWLVLYNLFLSQRVSAPEKEGLRCSRYTEEETYSRCDRKEISRCLQECCGQHYRPLWVGDRLEEISCDLPRQERPPARCKEFLLGEETSCLPPCTTTSVKVISLIGPFLAWELSYMFMLQTMFLYKTVSRKSVRYHTLTLSNR